MVPFAIAGVQMYTSALKENVTAMSHKIDLVMIKFPWTQMIVFSELAPYGPLTSKAKDFPHPDIKIFQDLAIKHNVWLIPGSMFENRDGKTYNTTFVINPAGELIGRYDKMFPFTPYEKGVEPGSEFLIFDIPDVGRFGVSICYDIWFPETTRTLTCEGVEVLIHPVLTGTADRDVELSIARSTAAMFQCYVVDINGLGAGGNGRSCMINPAGAIHYQSAGQEDILMMEIDLAQVRRQRETGLLGLGQLLKSFRDTSVEFPIYDKNSLAGQYLDTLGPLAMPERGTQAGLNVLSPADAIQKLNNDTETQQETQDKITAITDASIRTVHHLI
ncbi:MAG: carbon-nitrogen hydrolase family protein [Cocleimonas sp.]